MTFDSETKVRDIALSNSGARQILEDYGLDYCCGGGKSLHDACLRTNVSPEQILKRLRESSEQGASPESALWNTAPLGELTRHIEVKHHRYVRDAIPRISSLLEKVNGKHGKVHPEIAAILGLFTRVGQEMIMHMQKEEQILFPYIEALERARNGHAPLEPPFFQTVRNPIQAMVAEHDIAGDLVRQIRTASADYSSPADACTSYKAAYKALQEFEADLHQHVHLENNILFPRAIEMESAPHRIRYE